MSPRPRMPRSEVRSRRLSTMVEPRLAKEVQMRAKTEALTVSDLLWKLLKREYKVK